MEKLKILCSYYSLKDCVQLMGVLKGTMMGLLDSSRKRELTLMRFLMDNNLGTEL